MRPLPLNAAAAIGTTPDRPGRLGSAPVREQDRHGRLPLGLGGGVECARAHQIARVDGRAVGEEKLDQSRVSGARRARQRHGAQPIARLERSARRQKTARQRHAARISRREQHQTELHRGGGRLRQIEPAFELGTRRGPRNLRRSDGSRRQDGGRDKQSRSNEAPDGRHGYVGMDTLAWTRCRKISFHARPGLSRSHAADCPGSAPLVSSTARVFARGHAQQDQETALGRSRSCDTSASS